MYQRQQGNLHALMKLVVLLVFFGSTSITLHIHSFSIGTKSSSINIEHGIVSTKTYYNHYESTQRHLQVLMMSSSNNDNNNNDDDSAIDDVKFNKKRRYKTKKQSKDNENGEDSLSKEDIVKAVGETFRQRKQQGLASTTKDEYDKSTSSKASSGSGTSSTGTGGENNLLDRINPFKAGQNLRKTIDETLNQISSPVTTDPTQSKYYIDDRFLERVGGVTTGTVSSSKSISSKGKSLSDMARLLWEQDDYIPEVLVVGASGEIGRLIVKRLVLTGRCRVRVLVRDLYTKTLNMFGTSVTYCQGDLTNIDSLQYAVTDVDKLIFCATPPRPDEEQFRTKFQDYVQENLGRVPTQSSSLTSSSSSSSFDTVVATGSDDTEWEQLESVLDVRAKLAEQVDCIGLQNLLRAYQDVRHADYGTSQAAKRSLFKFEKDRPDDFFLFSINNEDGTTAVDDDDDDDDDDYDIDTVPTSIASTNSKTEKLGNYKDNYDDEDEYDKYDEFNYDDYDDEYGATSIIEERNNDVSVKVQTQWIQNRFNHGVFVGRVPTSKVDGGRDGEASIISTRLRSRDDPDSGIDLGGTSTSSSAAPFAGFIVRLCADGGTYEAFIRTGIHPDYGIEYVCEFSTATKSSSSSSTVITTNNTNVINKSKNKFITIRLPFENFKPVRHSSGTGIDDDNFSATSIPPFKGRDVQYLGFRYRASRNAQQQSSGLTPNKKKVDDWSAFYLSFSYIKLYRSQPEPEVIYLSDARIPSVVRDGMVRHGARRLVIPTDDDANVDSATVLVDDSTFKQAEVSKKAMVDGKMIKAIGRSPEEIYYKYRGEEILKKSGLSYAIVRVTGFNEVPTGEASTVDVSAIQPDIAKQGKDDVSTYVSRDEIAQVCVNALLDPNALNKSFYVTKKTTMQMQKQATIATIVDDDDEMASKFASLPADVIA